MITDCFFKRIRSVAKNRDAKRLFHNFTYLSVLQIANYIFPLITVPYLARVIGVDKFGEIAFASAIIGYFQTVVNFGFLYTATRDIAKFRDDKERLSRIFSAVMIARIALMMVSFLLLVVLILLVPQFYKNRILLLLTFCIIPGQILFPEWLFQGLERMKNITILNLVSRGIFTIAVFAFIKEKSDFILQPLFMAAGYFFVGLISFYIILKKFMIRMYIPSFDIVFSTIKGSFDVFINQLFPNLYNNFSMLLLGFWFGSYSNGILDAGNKFIGLSQQLMQVLSRTFFPFLSRNIQHHSTYFKISIVLSIFITIGLFFGAPVLFQIFFTEEFNDAVIVMRILSLSIIFLTLSNVFGVNFLIIMNHEKTQRNITIICSLIGFCLTWPMIYFFDFIGAAIVIVTTRGLIGITLMIKATGVKKQLQS